MRRLASVVTGRRAKWFVLVAWILAVVILTPIGSKLGDVTTDDTESFLPSSAESTEVVRQLDREFQGGETDTAIVVYQHSGGLTATDKQKILADQRAINEAGTDKINVIGPQQIPFTPGAQPGLVSKNGDVATAISPPRRTSRRRPIGARRSATSRMRTRTACRSTSRAGSGSP